MKVFLTGATGYVGSQILKDLVVRGYTPRCLVRTGSEGRLKYRTEDVEIVNGDVTEPETLKDALYGCDSVIHLVGIIREFPQRGITFEKVHLQATKNIVDAARQQGIKRFIYMSALGVRPDAKARYHTTKFQAESYLKQSGLEYTIFRPSVIFGRDDQFVNMLAGMIKKFFVPVIGKGRYKLQPVAIENVSEGFVRALEMPETTGKTYKIGGPERFAYTELLDSIGKAMDRKFVKLYSPVFPIKSLTSCFQNLRFFPLSVDQLIMLQEDNICDEKPFFDELGIEPIRFYEGIKRYLRPAM